MRITQHDLDICVALRREAESIEELLDAIRCDAEKAAAVLKLFPGGGGTGDRVGSLSAKLADLSAKYAQKIEQRMDHVSVVEDAMEEIVDPSLRDVLRFRYLDGLKWSEVAQRMNYSATQCRRFHSEALVAIANLKDGHKWTAIS